MNATATPATVAGKTVATVAPESITPAPATVPSIDDLRDALSAFDVVSDVTGANARALYDVVRARYAYHAASFAHLVETGDENTRATVAIVPDTFRTDIAGLMWRDATGNRKPVETALRTPGQRSLGQLVSRFAGVVTNMSHGVDALADSESARKAEADIKAAKDKASKQTARTRRARNHAAFIAWRDALPQRQREALVLAFDLVTDGPGTEHAEAFATAIMNAVSVA